MGGESGQFDLSDVGAADTLDGALSVAAEVLYEYGLCQGNTRIEVLARCVMLCLGEPQDCGFEEPEVVRIDGHASVRVPDEWPNHYTPTMARMLSGMLARAAEQAER